MEETRSMTMAQEIQQYLEAFYPDRRTTNYMYPTSFQSSRSMTDEGNAAEEIVYNILCQINEPMFTMHSKRFCVFQAGEIDFLICNKNRGIIILEVKSGGKGKKRKEGKGKKRKEGKDYAKATLQLEKAARAVKEKVKKIKNGDVSVRYAVVMPNVSREQDSPIHVEGCYKEDLASKETFEFWLNTFMPVLNDRMLNDTNYDKCLACFVPVFTDYDINSIHSHLKRLTPQQAEILEGLNEEAYITGPAGSGKTECMVIKASSKELKDQNKLVVVFNKPLRDHLGKNSLLEVENITVITFYKLLREIIKDRKREDFINNENNKPYIVKAAIEIILGGGFTDRYDSIFIDEAQDMFGEWEVLFDILHNKGKSHYKWFFYDNNQMVRYSTGPKQEKTKYQEYHLTKVIRNTKNIFQASMSFYHSNKAVKIAHDIEGPKVEEKHFTDVDIENLSSVVVQFLLECIVTLSNVCLAGVVGPGDICILMESEERANFLGSKIKHQSNDKIVPFKLTQMIEYMLPGKKWPIDQLGARSNIGVTVDSVSRFKGLESKAVILLMNARMMRQAIEKFYVGTTRAFCHLTVICSESGVKYLKSEIEKLKNV